MQNDYQRLSEVPGQTEANNEAVLEFLVHQYYVGETNIS